MHRAVQFTQSLTRFGPEAVRAASAADPLTEEQLAVLQSSLASTIPGSLADFLRLESASCNCEYSLRIQREPTENQIAMLGPELGLRIAQKHVYGGASLCQSERFVRWNAENVKTAFNACRSRWPVS